jgi:chemotaxis protein MotA
MIGTLMGLVLMLVNLDDKAMVGPYLAVAIITTFYGAVSGLPYLYAHFSQPRLPHRR